MRFVPDGPAIPNELIKEWRDGKVLFLAGAGVSLPARLPLFRGLALEIYEHLRDPLHSALTSGDKDERLARCRESTSLSPEQKIEAELFLDNQLDRLFAAMEARLDQDKHGRLKYRKVRDALEAVLRRASNCAEGHRDLVRLSLDLGVDQGRAAACRLATTNYDLLFEDAWQKEFGRKPESFDARMAPRPGAHDFKGIIHIHGMLNADAAIPGQFVLSSRDFARYYLRSGVVANYIYDLVRRYRIVLVGYSADDPPMRYLMDAIGEDASLFGDMRYPCAIAARQPVPYDPIGQIASGRWKAKNIDPILFEERMDGDPFAPLWETLHAWAEWARDDMDWVQRQLVEKTSVPFAGASAFASAFTQDLLSLLDRDELEMAIRSLRSAGVDFGWIEVLEASLRNSAR